MKSISRAALVGLWMLAASPVFGQIVVPGATVQLLATYDGTNNFTESPLYDGNGGVYVSDMWPRAGQTTSPSHIWRYDIGTMMSTQVDPNSGTANGTIFNPLGAVISADRDRKQISLRSLLDVSMVETVLTDNYNGTAYNGPNDLIQDANGGIYFTDPGFEANPTLTDALYYRSAAGVVSQLRTYPNQRPNGVILSPDGTTLYANQWQNRMIVKYDVAADGTLSGDTLFVTTNTTSDGANFFGRPDGMTVDADGNLYVSVGTRVMIWAPNQTRYPDIVLPAGSTNVDLGGANGTTLFITAAKSLYSIELVPEPSSLTLLLVGCLMLVRRGRRTV